MCGSVGGFVNETKVIVLTGSINTEINNLKWQCGISTTIFIINKVKYFMKKLIDTKTMLNINLIRKKN